MNALTDLLFSQIGFDCAAALASAMAFEANDRFVDELAASL
jgi:hypothetical protein